MTTFLILFAVAVAWVLSLLVHPFGKCCCAAGQHPPQGQAPGAEVPAVQGPEAPPAARIPHRPPDPPPGRKPMEGTAMRHADGAHTHGHGGGLDLLAVAGPVAIAVAVVIVVEFILSIIVWLAIALGVVLVLAAAGLIWWLRGAPKRKAEFDAAYAAAFEARRPARTVTATVIPQVQQPEQPAIELHYHSHYHAAPESPARIVIPGTAGDAITEGN